MIQQAGLFDHPAPIASKRDPWTSHDAARDITTSGQRAEQKLAVLKALHKHPGSTSAELAKATGLERHLCGRRLPDLRMDGLVVNCRPLRPGEDPSSLFGVQQTRRCTVTGRAALVWYPK